MKNMSTGPLPIRRRGNGKFDDGTELAHEIRAEIRALSRLLKAASSVEEGVDIARTHKVELIVVDRVRHHECAPIANKIREHGVEAPVLFISKPHKPAGRVRRSELGAESPISDVVARIGALARRLDDISVARLRFADIEMDLIGRTVKRAGKGVILRAREFRLLEFFLRRPGVLVTPAMLIEGVWRNRVPLSTNVIHVNIGQLRRKIDSPGKGSLIVTIRSAGFMFGENA